MREERNAAEASAALERIRDAARGTDNMLLPMRDALRARCTIGEICGVLRTEWGEHDRRTLYITALTGVYRIRLDVPGVPLPRSNP